MTEPDVIRALPLSSPTSVPGSLVSFEELPHAGGRRIAVAFSHAYTRWPQTHRPEEPDQAIQLDRWLEEVRGGHPRYTRLDNAGRD
jgi:hypothetical protein